MVVDIFLMINKVFYQVSSIDQVLEKIPVNRFYTNLLQSYQFE